MSAVIRVIALVHMIKNKHIYYMLLYAVDLKHLLFLLKANALYLRVCGTISNDYVQLCSR